jgi:hypothetical protein
LFRAEFFPPGNGLKNHFFSFLNRKSVDFHAGKFIALETALNLSFLCTGLYRTDLAILKNIFRIICQAPGAANLIRCDTESFRKFFSQFIAVFLCGDIDAARAAI